jgi:hypothetical protein
MVEQKFGASFCFDDMTDYALPCEASPIEAA